MFWPSLATSSAVTHFGPSSYQPAAMLLLTMTLPALTPGVRMIVRPEALIWSVEAWATPVG